MRSVQLLFFLISQNSPFSESYPNCKACLRAILALLFTVILQESKILKFLGFMWNPLSWVMEAAAIMAIALANGGVSSLQSSKLF